MTSTGILPTYVRFVNGVPVPSFSRRSFRPREKYLILLVFLTFGVVCFGAFFFLPEFRSSSSTVNSSVYKVYQHMQKAGPELLIPAPPHLDDLGDVPNVIRHNDHKGLDPHFLDDRDRLQAKIEEDQALKVLERPNIDMPPPKPSPSLEIMKGGNGFLEMPMMGNGIGEQLDDNSLDSFPVVTVPPAPSNHYPDVNKGEDKDPVARERRNKVKEMMGHAWNNYKLYAWGKNELRPISKRGHTSSIFGASSLGATILDGLDTLYVMGMDKEFQEGRDWIAENLNMDNIVSDLSVFETTIRFIGGLLTCYALTGDIMFRDKAQHVADKLLPAFQTPTGIPHSLINPSTGISKNYGWASGGSSILSEIGTLHLEFSYLSDVTGNPIYREKVERVRKVLRDMEKPKGLYPNYINPKTGKWGQHHMSLGGLGDSYYEYLLKAWLQNKDDFESRQMFDDAMKAIIDNMIRVSNSGLTYVADLKYDRILEDKMDHLSCFSGGLFALAAKSLRTSLSDRYMELARGLTNTCHESYDRSPTKLGPEAFRFSDAVEAKALKSNEKYYILRPETIESYFILWRITKDQKYREWGWEALQAIEKHCRVDGGFTGIRNVYLEDSPKDDVQQSFFLAETLKYLYLLFSDDSLISLDDWVLNTEAHPLPMKGNPYYRGAH